jgi:hypothetical protein
MGQGTQRRTLTEREFNVLASKVLDAAPPNLSQPDFERWVDRTMQQEIDAWERRPEPVNLNSSLRRTVTNFGRMVNPINLAEGAVEAIASPIQTVKNVWGQMGDQATKAREAFGEGRYSEAVGHGLASSVPIIGPAAAGVGEQIAEGDVAGGLGAAAGLAAVSSPSAISATARGARNIVPAGARERMASALDRGAADRVTSVMVPEVGPNKVRFGNRAAEIAPELSNRGTARGWTREGFHERVKESLASAEAKLDEAANARLSALSFDTKPIIEALKQRRARLTAEAVEGSQNPRTLQERVSNIVDPSGKPVVVEDALRRPLGKDVVPAPNRARVAQIDQAIAELEALGPRARYEAIRRIRESYDGPAKTVYNQSMTADFLAKKGESLGAADVTGVLREKLGAFDPNTAAANAEYSLFRTADDVLTATAEIERVRPKVGRRIMARLTGTLGGGHVAGAEGAVAGFFLAPVMEAASGAGLTTKLKTAQIMTNLAKAIRKGDEGRAALLISQLRALGLRAVQVQGATSPSGSPQPATAGAK